MTPYGTNSCEITSRGIASSRIAPYEVMSYGVTSLEMIFLLITLNAAALYVLYEYLILQVL